MSYGLDFDQVRYEVDAQGKKLAVIVPPNMFSALTEFWIAARRAQTEHIERTTKPGQFKASLHAVKSTDEGAHEADAAAQCPGPRAPFAHDRHWQSLLQKMPDAPPPDEPAAHPHEHPHEHPAPPPAPPGKSPRTPKHKQTFYPREFCAPIPEEVAALIGDGVYFLKAWRIHRELDLKTIAELFGITRPGVQTFDYGYSKPGREALERFAIAYDCTLDQLTVKPGSNAKPWLKVIEAPQAEAFAPAHTDYPNAVLLAIEAGKTPLTAWRLYRGISRAELASRYGERVGEANIRKMEEAVHLSTKTMVKLSKCLKCEPVQLLRPEGFVIREHHHETPSSRRISEAMMQAGR